MFDYSTLKLIWWLLVGVLLVVEMYLMVKFARMGPGSLGTGRYQSEPVHA